eukprot:jgi/Orpsp1_1/1177387/evm.model.c7180000061273.1
MKFFNIFFIFASIIGLVYCDGSTNYELTYYGQKGEEHTKKNPSCPQYDDDNLPRYFAALGQRLSHYKDYCDNYAVFMSSDGSNVKTIAKAMIVDSCRECGAYHLDVSLNIFTKIADEDDGEARIIWGVYSKSGKEVAGPWYGSVSGTAKKLGISSSAFVSAFRANAKKLASSGSYYASFSTSGISLETTTRKTTTTTTTTTTLTTKRIIGVTTTLNPKGLPSKATTTNTLPFANASKALPLGTASVSGTATATSTVTPLAKPSSVAQTPGKNVEPIIIEKEKEEDGGFNSALGIIAIGGGCLGAAGVGLLLMKKKSPSTYEGMKQKFPDAFSNIKRGLTRSATSIKRKVNRNNTSQYNDIVRV